MVGQGRDPDILALPDLACLHTPLSDLEPKKHTPPPKPRRGQPWGNDADRSPTKEEEGRGRPGPANQPFNNGNGRAVPPER